MAQISTYATLKAAIANALGRDVNDSTDILVSNLDLMIQLAEKKFERRLKLKQLMRRATTALNEEDERLPSNLARIININYKSTGGEWKALQYVTPRQYRAQFAYAGSPPDVYTTIGHEILVAPYASEDTDEGSSPTLEVIYWSKPVPLSDTNTTNEVLEDYPEIYLYGALVQSALWIQSDMLQVWMGMLEQAINEANDETEDTVHEGVQMTPSDAAP